MTEPPKSKKKIITSSGNVENIPAIKLGNGINDAGITEISVSVSDREPSSENLNFVPSAKTPRKSLMMLEQSKKVHTLLSSMEETAKLQDGHLSKPTSESKIIIPEIQEKNTVKSLLEKFQQKSNSSKEGATVGSESINNSCPSLSKDKTEKPKKYPILGFVDKQTGEIKTNEQLSPRSKSMINTQVLSQTLSNIDSNALDQKQQDFENSKSSFVTSPNMMNVIQPSDYNADDNINRNQEKEVLLGGEHQERNKGVTAVVEDADGKDARSSIVKGYVPEPEMDEESSSLMTNTAKDYSSSAVFHQRNSSDTSISQASNESDIVNQSTLNAVRNNNNSHQSSVVSLQQQHNSGSKRFELPLHKLQQQNRESVDRKFNDAILSPRTVELMGEIETQINREIPLKYEGPPMVTSDSNSNTNVVDGENSEGNKKPPPKIKDVLPMSSSPTVGHVIHSRTASLSGAGFLAGMSKYNNDSSSSTNSLGTNNNNNINSKRSPEFSSKVSSTSLESNLKRISLKKDDPMNFVAVGVIGGQSELIPDRNVAPNSAASLLSPRTINRIESMVFGSEHQKAASVIQKVFLFKRRGKKFLQLAKARKPLLQEVESTEKSFIASLEAILWYLHQARKEKILDNHLLLTLFSNVEQIYSLNSNLYRNIVHRAGNPPSLKIERDLLKELAKEDSKQPPPQLQQIGNMPAMTNTVNSGNSKKPPDVTPPQTPQTPHAARTANKHLTTAEMMSVPVSKPKKSLLSKIFGASNDVRASINPETKMDENFIPMALPNPPPSVVTTSSANSGTSSSVGLSSPSMNTSVSPSSAAAVSSSSSVVMATPGLLSEQKINSVGPQEFGMILNSQQQSSASSGLLDAVISNNVEDANAISSSNINNNNNINYKGIVETTSENALGGNKKYPFQSGLTVGEIFKIYAPLLKPVYTVYLCNYPQATDLFKKLKNESKPFQEFLARMKLDQRTNGKELFSLIIEPVQRIPRIQMLLKGLLKNTSPMHHEYAATASALDMINEVTLYMNEKKRLKDTQTALMKMSERFTLNVSSITAGHRNIMDQVTAKVQMQNSSLWSEVEIYLFSDIIYMFNVETEMQKLKKSYHLVFCSVPDFKNQDSMNQKENTFELRFLVGNLKFLIELDSKGNAVKWRTMLQEAIRNEKAALQVQISDADLMQMITLRNDNHTKLEGLKANFQKTYAEYMRILQQYTNIKRRYEEVLKELEVLPLEYQKTDTVLSFTRHRIMKQADEMQKVNDKGREHNGIFLKLLRNDESALKLYFNEGSIITASSVAGSVNSSNSGSLLKSPRAQQVDYTDFLHIPEFEKLDMSLLQLRGNPPPSYHHQSNNMSSLSTINDNNDNSTHMNHNYTSAHDSITTLFEDKDNGNDPNRSLSSLTAVSSTGDSTNSTFGVSLSNNVGIHNSNSLLSQQHEAGTSNKSNGVSGNKHSETAMEAMELRKKLADQEKLFELVLTEKTIENENIRSELDKVKGEKAKLMDFTVQKTKQHNQELNELRKQLGLATSSTSYPVVADNNNTSSLSKK